MAAVLIAMNGCCARALWTVQGARDELFPGSRLAGNEDGRARLRKPADRAEHFLHRGRLAENFRFRKRLVCLAFAPSLLERAPDEVDRLVDVERLGGTRRRRPGTPRPRCRGRVRGHDDDGHRGMALLHRLQELGRAPRHADVGDEHLGRRAGERVERFLRRRKRVVRDAFPAERLLDHPADGTVVVDDPDRFHLIGSRILNIVRPGPTRTR